MERIFCRGVWFLLVGVIFMAFTSSAAMASGIQITEKGTKGLGNAWTGGAAVAEDASTVYWNPAGLTRLDGNHVELSMHFIRPSFKFDDDGSTTVLGQVEAARAVVGNDRAVALLAHHLLEHQGNVMIILND